VMKGGLRREAAGSRFALLGHFTSVAVESLYAG